MAGEKNILNQTKSVNKMPYTYFIRSTLMVCIWLFRLDFEDLCAWGLMNWTKHYINSRFNIFGYFGSKSKISKDCFRLPSPSTSRERNTLQFFRFSVYFSSKFNQENALHNKRFILDQNERIFAHNIGQRLHMEWENAIWRALQNFVCMHI